MVIIKVKDKGYIGGVGFGYHHEVYLNSDNLVSWSKQPWDWDNTYPIPEEHERKIKSWAVVITTVGGFRNTVMESVTEEEADALIDYINKSFSGEL